MKPKKPSPIGANTLNAIEWLHSIIPDTPEMRAIEEEEWTKYNLAIALIQAREAAGHTQSTLAAELGVQQSLISKWEKVHHNHTLETLLQLCNATSAKLVMGLEINGQLIPITKAMERCIPLSERTYEQVLQRSRESGLSPREIILAPLVGMVSSSPVFDSSYQTEPRAKNVLTINPKIPQDESSLKGVRYASS